jgi:hypothetical protein
MSIRSFSFQNYERKKRIYGPLKKIKKEIYVVEKKRKKQFGRSSWNTQ